MRLYDMGRDEFITERSAIIDALVKRAAFALTYTERSGRLAAWNYPPPEVKAVLSKALRGAGGVQSPRYAVMSLVRDSWHGSVAA